MPTSAFTQCQQGGCRTDDTGTGTPPKPISCAAYTLFLEGHRSNTAPHPRQRLLKIHARTAYRSVFWVNPRFPIPFSILRRKRDKNASREYPLCVGTASEKDTQCHPSLIALRLVWRLRQACLRCAPAPSLAVSVVPTLKEKDKDTPSGKSVPVGTVRARGSQRNRKVPPSTLSATVDLQSLSLRSAFVRCFDFRDALVTLNAHATRHTLPTRNLRLHQPSTPHQKLRYHN